MSHGTTLSSSVALWNCAHPANRKLTPEFVDTAHAMDLHRFTWLQDAEIGGLDVRWSWLVREYGRPARDVKNFHRTVGGPYFHEYRDVDFAKEWFAQNHQLSHCMQRKKP